MRSTLALQLTLLLSLATIVSASACWVSKGLPPAGGVVVDFYGSFNLVNPSAAVVTTSGGTTHEAGYNESGWYALPDIPDFNAQASSGAVVVFGKSTSCVGVSPCAKIKKNLEVFGGGVGWTDSNFTIQGFSSSDINKTNFKRFVFPIWSAGLIPAHPPTSFLIADRGVVFESNGDTDFKCGYDFCGRQVLTSGEFTAFAIDGDSSGELLGTNTGGIYKLTKGFVLRQLGVVPGGSTVKAITRLGSQSTGELWVILANGQVYYSQNNGGSWVQPTFSLPAGNYQSLVPASRLNVSTSGSSTNAGSYALYTADAGTTYAFTRNGLETYTAAPQPAGAVMFSTILGGSYYGGGPLLAISLSNGELFTFECSASPAIPDAGTDATISTGQNFARTGTNQSGLSAVHNLVTSWSLTSPGGVSPTSVFQTYSSSGASLNGVNAVRPGTYTFEYSTQFDSFPRLRATDTFILTVQGSGTSPPPAPVDRCAGVTCPQGQACDSANGLCTSTQTQCTTQSQCSDSEACIAGRCGPLDCGSGTRAVAHKCRTICEDNSACTQEESCISGTCRLLTCPEDKPVLLDHGCIAIDKAVQCGGQLRNTQNGICCSNIWVPGATECPGQAANATAAGAQTQPPQSQTDTLLLGLVGVMVLVVIGLAYFLFIRKPPAAPA